MTLPDLFSVYPEWGEFVDFHTPSYLCYYYYWFNKSNTTQQQKQKIRNKNLLENITKQVCVFSSICYLHTFERSNRWKKKT